MQHPKTISEVIENGLCIGCGLCESIAENLKMELIDEKVLRPVGSVTHQEQDQIISACPGAIIASYTESGVNIDEIWGAWLDLSVAWSAEPQVRFEASTGGVLTALGRHALNTGQAKFVLHAGPHKTEPLLSDWVISETPEEVLANSGSRYAPIGVLAGLETALKRKEPFVLIAKPCDINAARQLATLDRRMDEYCIAMLVMVCGGASELIKTRDAVSMAGVRKEDVSSFRYRGYGNPGPHRITLKDGTYRDIDYNTMWGEESGWLLQSRCKICADPIGEAADIAASDCWPGGSPSGDDEGFNGVLVRTKRGQELFASAVASGMIEVGDAATPEDFSIWQPHQVRKSIAIEARFSGLSDAGQPVPELNGLRKQELSKSNENYTMERTGTKTRALDGKFHEISFVKLTN